MSKRLFYTEDGRPNIVIVPTMSLSTSKQPTMPTSTLKPENEPPLKKPRLEDIPLPVKTCEQYNFQDQPLPPGTTDILSVPEYYVPIQSGISNYLPAQQFQYQNELMPPNMPDLLPVQHVPYSNQPLPSTMPDFTMPTTSTYNMECAPLYNAATSSHLYNLAEKSSVHWSMCETPQHYVATTECLTSSTSTASTNVLPINTNETTAPEVNSITQKSSWASNYLMSIGQAFGKEIKINLSKKKKKLFSAKGKSEKQSTKAIKNLEKNHINDKNTQNETEEIISTNNNGVIGSTNNSGVVETVQTQLKCTTPNNSNTITKESTQLPDIGNRSETASYKSQKSNSSMITNESTQASDISNKSETAYYKTQKPKSYCDDVSINRSNCKEDNRPERPSREKNISHRRERRDSRERHGSNYDSYKHRRSDDRYSPGYSRTSHSREEKSLKTYRNVDTHDHEVHKRRDYTDRSTSRTSSQTKIDTSKSYMNTSLRPNTRERSDPETRSGNCDSSSSVKSKSSQSSTLKSIVTTKEKVKSPEAIDTAFGTFDLRSKLTRKNVRDCLSDSTGNDETREILNKINEQISAQVKKTLDERFGDIRSQLFPSNSNQVENLKISVSNGSEDKPIAEPNVEEKTQTNKAETGTAEKSQLKYKNRKKGKKRKNIKLVIQVICDESDSSDSVEVVESTDFCRPPIEDLSFLDDFNVDEIVDTLKGCNEEPNSNVVYNLVSDDEISNASTVQLEELGDILEEITGADDEKKPFELKNEATSSNNCKESGPSFPKMELGEPLLNIKQDLAEDIENKPVVFKQENNIIDEDKHGVDTVKKTQIKQETPDIAVQTNVSLMSNITMTDIYRNLDKSHYNIRKATEPEKINSEIKQEPFEDISEPPYTSKEVLSDANIAMIADDFLSSKEIVEACKEVELSQKSSKPATENSKEVIESESQNNGVCKVIAMINDFLGSKEIEETCEEVKLSENSSTPATDNLFAQKEVIESESKNNRFGQDDAKMEENQPSTTDNSIAQKEVIESEYKNSGFGQDDAKMEENQSSTPATDSQKEFVESESNNNCKEDTEMEDNQSNTTTDHSVAAKDNLAAQKEVIDSESKNNCKENAEMEENKPNSTQTKDNSIAQKEDIESESTNNCKDNAEIQENQPSTNNSIAKNQPTDNSIVQKEVGKSESKMEEPALTEDIRIEIKEENKCEPLNEIKSEPLPPSADIISHANKTKTPECTKSNKTVPSPPKRSTIQNPSQVKKIDKPLTTNIPDSEKSLVETLERNMKEKLKDSYQIVSFIKQGRYSKIFHSKSSAGKSYVVKYFREFKLNIGLSKKKLLEDLQKDIPAENLYNIGCINSFVVNHKYCLIMDYFPKDLEQLLKERKMLSISTVQCLSKQLVTAVNVLRQKNIIHSDIKPAHVLVNKTMDKLKLCGFDCAYYANKPPLRAPSHGTVNYRPPENILEYPADFSTDVWSTALVMYEMSTGRQLFPGRFNNDILYKQMCTVGYVPVDMLVGSYNTNQHFIGNRFVRRYGRLPYEYVLHNEYDIRYNNILRSSLTTTYYNNWGKAVCNAQKKKDVSKLNQLIQLLLKMLTIHPLNRISIEFVYADPFFTPF